MDSSGSLLQVLLLLLHSPGCGWQILSQAEIIVMKLKIELF
jgi:hypothetical protein